MYRSDPCAVRHARRSIATFASVALLVPVQSFAAEEQEQKAEEVTITGTHLRGAAPVGVKPITISQEDIRAGGFTRIEEVLRALPQNFGGGPREDTLLPSDASDPVTSTNLSKGAGVNLRGLGSGATLVLVNGRRLAPSGTTGLFTDVSQLPLLAIERIEVLTDGASAIYGSDAVGGVINVILRRDYIGATTSVRAAGGAGSTRDYHFNQLFGGAWDTGTANISYEYVERDALRATSRPFSADTDQRPRGGDNWSPFTANPGTIVIGTRTWAIPANQDGRNLDPAALVEGTVNFQNKSQYLDLLPEQKRQSATGFVSQRIGERLTWWAQGFATRRESLARFPWTEQLRVPATNPFYVNPTGGTGDIVVRYDLTEDFGRVGSQTVAKTYSATSGVDVKPGGEWNIAADFSQSEERARVIGDGVNRTELARALADPDPQTALNPFGDGAHTNPATIDRIRAKNSNHATSRSKTVSVLVDGPLWRLGGEEVRLALGADHRELSFVSERATVTANGERHLNAAFAELRVPVVGSESRRIGLHELALSAAVRREEYSDFGASTVPRFGMSWSPVAPVTFRATWSESFRAPDLASLDESRNSFLLRSVPDPLAANGTSTILQWSGGNSQLRPETADSLSAGIDFDVPWISDLRIALTYFDIEYVNRLQPPFAGITSLAELLGNPAYSPYVTRNPDAQLRERVCNSGNPADANREACLTTPIAAIVDTRIANTALLNTDGVDFDITLRRLTALGEIRAGVTATHILSYEQATVETFPLTSLLNRKYMPVDTRLRTSTAWARGQWAAVAFVNYFDHYKDVTTAGTRKISSWTTVDFDLAYEPANLPGALSGLSAALNARNVLNRDPPFVNAELGYDMLNANPYGRVVSVLLRKEW